MTDHLRMVELYKKEEKFQKLYTTFRPNIKASPITNKFYARHDAYVNLKDAPNSDFVEMLAKAKYLGPKDKYPAPLTESQKYGWHHKPFIPRNEDILLFPHVEAPAIKLELILKENYKNEMKS